MMDLFAITGTAPILILIFAGVVLSVVGAAGLLARKDPTARLAGIVGSGGEIDGATGSALSDRGARARLAKMDALIAPQDESKRSAMRLKLVQAGYRNTSAITTFFFLRYLLVLIPLIGVLALYPLLASKLSTEQLGLATAGLMAAGFFLPSLWVMRRTKARQRAVSVAFPDTLDMMLICVEAGLGLDAAINRVSKEIGAAHPVLGEELLYTTAELRAGKSRQDVLRDLAKRVGVDDVRAFVTVIVQADRYGTSVAEAMRVYAQDMRAKRMVRAEEKANKLDVKLTVAVFGLTMPAVLMFTVIPAIIQVAEQFMKMGTKL
jgi:tight adherence protein C